MSEQAEVLPVKTKIKTFREAFGKLNVPERLMNVFGDANVTSVVLKKDERKMTVTLKTAGQIKDSLFAEVERHIAAELPYVDGVLVCRSAEASDADLHVKKIDSGLSPDEYYGSISKWIAEESPACGKMLAGAAIDVTGGDVEIRLRGKHSFLYTVKRIDKVLENRLFNATGISHTVRFVDGDEVSEAKPVVLREQEVVSVKHEVKRENDRGQQPAFGKRRGSRGGPALKNDISGVMTMLSETLEDGDDILIEGEILSLETRETRSGKLLYQMDVTDKTDSICVKFFLDGKKSVTDEFEALIRVGNTVKVFGETRFDDFLREQIIMAKEFAPGTKKTGGRVDLSAEKRVELHLHTQMSQMDATSSATDYIKRAKEFGMDTIAITDHGVVQAFPEAAAAAKKHGVKIIYGMEAYIVDDLGAVVKNPTDLTLDDDFVVFDVETTGLNADNCEIIEIGAVRVKNGEIISSFGALIKPKSLLPAKIVSLTGITDELLSDKPAIGDVLPKFLEFSAGAVLVAHNAEFDTAFVSRSADRLGLRVNQSSLCTLELSRALYPGKKNHKLAEMVKELKITLENHHRAVDDARATAELFLVMRKTLQSQGVNRLSDINVYAKKNIDVKKLPYHHAIVLAKNYIGLKHLYELVSMSHLNYYSKRPRVPKSLILEKREGLILGTACEAGEFFKGVIENRPEPYMAEIAAFYDYLEIQPVGNNMYLFRENRVESVEALKDLNRKIVAYGEKFGKPVIGTCDVHFLDPEDSIFREIIMSGEGFADASLQAPLYFRTTEEMLAEFDYLGEEKAREVVIYNTRMIADMTDNIKPVPDGTFPPQIDGAEETLKTMVRARMHEVYGDTPPDIVTSRVEREMGSIIKNGFAVLYVAAERLVRRSIENGYLVGSRGSVGSSIAATLSGITEVNPLPPHYYCSECKYTEFDSVETNQMKGGSGCDMPDKNCPKCGVLLKKDGHDIPFETFLGFDADKEPDIDLNFSGEYQSKAHAHAEELFGEGYVFKAGTIGTLADKTAFGFVSKYLEGKGINRRTAEKNRLVRGLTGIKRTTGQHPGGLVIVPRGRSINEFCPVQRPANDQGSNVKTTHFDYHSMEGRLLKLDILGHDVPTIIRMLYDFTGLDPTTINLGDKGIMSLFSSPDALGVSAEKIGCKTGTLGIPEFGTSFVRQMLMDTKPSTFSELVKISGLSHGTDVWFNNAYDIITKNIASFSEIIPTRDDIMLYLISKGVEKKAAFTIMEKVRKGRGVTDEEADMMRAADVPEWYIESCRKIQYLFPKGHAVAYVMMAVRICYYKIHYPAAFYAASYSVKAVDFDYELMCKGEQAAKSEMARITSLGKDATAKEKSTYTLLELVCEMYARGVKFSPIDLYASDAVKFKICDDGSILPPFCTLQGLGENAAASIVEARADGEFISIEDFKSRTRVSKTVTELIIKNGILRGIPETNQLSFFSLLDSGALGG